MKIYTDLQELLEDFDYWLKKDNYLYEDDSSEKRVERFLSSNSLTLDKQRPLAKNKQFDNACDKCDGTGLMRQELISTCNRCYGSGKKQA